MAAAAASTNQPGSGSDPLVFKYDPSTQTVTRVTFRNTGSNGLPAWEGIVYHDYKHYAHDKITMTSDSSLEHKWKELYTNNGTLYGYETVNIQAYAAEIPTQPGSRATAGFIRVLIFQPSWTTGTTLYIVDNPKMLSLDDDIQKDLIRNAAIWWRKKQSGQSGGLRRSRRFKKSRRTCRTRRTRRK